MKKCIVFFNIIFSLAIAMLSFAFVNFSSQDLAISVSAEQEAQTEPTLFDFVSISQEGHVFEESDFVKNSISTGTEFLYLYTTHSITISNFFKSNANDSFNIFLLEYGEQTLATDITEDTNYYQTINQNRYYVFPSNPSQDTITNIRVEFKKYISFGSYRTYKMDFTLVQIAEDFNTDTNLNWSYNSYNFKSPTNGETYPNLKLHFPAGTTHNPIHVKFNFMGGIYEVYSIENKIYNAKDDSEIELTEYSTNSPFGIYKSSGEPYIYFHNSGIYEVEIFDNTINCYDKPNYLKYNFTIENNSLKTKNFYINAYTPSGEKIIDDQTTNSNVQVDFNNISSLRNDIKNVKIERSYRVGGNQMQDVNEYTSNKLPTSINFTKDGTYTITVFARSGDIIKDFKFNILKEIRTSFIIGDKTYDASNKAFNTTYTEQISRTVDTQFGNISGSASYNFNLTVARSNPSINGIDNNARTKENIYLTIYGVGNINVSVTHNGATTNYTVKNGTILPQITETGDYFVKVTDQMGSTVTKSFTISIRLNGAAYAIIIVAAIFILIAIVAIIISRSRVRVR